MTQNCFTPTEIWNLLRLLLIVNFLVYIWLICKQIIFKHWKMRLYYFPPLPKKAQPPSKSKNNFDHYSKKFIPLECKTYIKYLGVLIANNLTWKQHSNYINEKKNS